MMDYDRYDPVTRYPPGKFLKMVSGSASFPLLELILDPTRTPPQLLKDAILVSIDLESRYIKKLDKIQITQVGVASLDTRTLRHVDLESPQSLVNAIQSREFSIHPKRASRSTWAPKCMWATPEKIEHDEICDKLNEVLFELSVDSATEPGNASGCHNSATQKEFRNVILVGHSIRCDRSLLLELLGFDLKRVKSIRAILDTGRMMCSAYDLGIASHSHFPLRMILRCLGVRYDQLHDAGNDAMFTMKALLLMFANWRYQQGRYLWNIAEGGMDNVLRSQRPVNISTAETLLWDCQLEVLAAIAREPWPVQKKPAAPPRLTTFAQPDKPGSNLLLSGEDLSLAHAFS